jgi:hypothetical protein
MALAPCVRATSPPRARVLGVSEQQDRRSGSKGAGVQHARGGGCQHGDRQAEWRSRGTGVRRRPLPLGSVAGLAAAHARLVAVLSVVLSVWQVSLVWANGAVKFM